MSLDFGSPEVVGVSWLNPCELFEIRLRQEIKRIEQCRTLNFKRQAKNKMKPFCQATPNQAITSAASRLLRAAALVFLLFLLLPAPAPAATVVGTIQDITFQPYGGVNNAITFTPLSCPQAVAVVTNGVTNNITVWDVARTARITNGAFRVSLAGGIYYASFATHPPLSASTRVKILVPPNDTNTYQFNTCAHLATNLGTFVWTNGVTSGFTGTVTNSLIQIFTNSTTGYTVSGAGTAAANGFYSYYPPLASYYVSSVAETISTGWRNTNNYVLITLEASTVTAILNSTNVDTAWTSNGYLYEDIGLGWTSQTGTNPAPSVSFSTTSTVTTNYSFNLTTFANGLCVTNRVQ